MKTKQIQLALDWQKESPEDRMITIEVDPWKEKIYCYSIKYNKGFSIFEDDTEKDIPTEEELKESLNG